MKLTDLKPNDRNPRTIKTEAFRRLCASIQRDPEFMTLRPIVHRDGKILGGNMRWRACQELGMTEIPDTWAVEAATLSEEQARRFMLVDNAPEGMAGEWDWEMLAADWEVPELEALGFSLPSSEQETEPDTTYSGKIVAPVYEPKGERPPIQALYDRTKTDELIAGIDAADLPAEVAAFLRLAAERHTVFNFRQIAEFYCHVEAPIQDLMERSGLVIIDFKKAIEYGFVHLTERLGALADQEEFSEE